jgi:deoxyribonuclease V
LVLDGEVVGFWLRTVAGVRPLAVHPGWKVDAFTALEVVRNCWCRRRTPEPLREARRLARVARDQSDHRDARARR